MPAGGPDSDCHCGGSACTKWSVLYGGAYSSGGDIEGWLLASLDGQASPWPGNVRGPGDRLLEDAYNCRSRLEFDVDLDAAELILTSHIPPHIDCMGGEVVPGEFIAQRRISGTHTGNFSNSGSGRTDWGIGATKLVKLIAGWRVRIHLITDSVTNAINTQWDDLHWHPWRITDLGAYVAPGGSRFGTEFSFYGPTAMVCPAVQPYFTYKPCQLADFTPNEQYFLTWPYPEIDKGLLSDETEWPPPYRSVNMGEYGHKRSLCVLESDIPGTPPPLHPVAPVVDQYASSHTAFGAQSVYATPASGPGQYRVSGTGLDAVYAPYEPGEKRRQTFVEFDQVYQNNDQEWFTTKYYAPIFGEWFEESDFVDWDDPRGPSYDQSAAGAWAATPWSNLDAWQAQKRSTVSGEWAPATDPQPPRVAYWAYPPIVSRGYEGTGGAMRHGTVRLRPTSPTDTAWVDRQIAGFEEAFTNVTFHEFALPEYPVASTPRTRTIDTVGWLPYLPTSAARPYYHRYFGNSYDDYGFEGAQNGCTNPGICDMETVVPIIKTGLWVLKYFDTSSPLTADGSTSVCSFIIEKPDPDNAGEWLPVDLTTLCKPDPTPDHTGWQKFSTPNSVDAPYLSIAVADIYGPFVRVDKGPVCRAWSPIGVSYLNHSGQAFVDYWLSNEAYDVFRSGVEYNIYITDNASDYAVCPLFVLNSYNQKVQWRKCCGYNEVVMPLVSSYCHPTTGIDSVYVKRVYTEGPASGTAQWYRRRVTNPIGDVSWIIPW